MTQERQRACFTLPTSFVRSYLSDSFGGSWALILDLDRYLPTIAGYGSEQNLDGLKSTMSHFVETCWGFHCQEPLRPVSGKQFSLNDALQEFRESGDSCRVTQYIRGMFLEWLYQDYQHSTLTANPSWPHEFLRHEAIYKELQAHIQCGVRIALLYIYQESKLPSGQRGKVAALSM